LKAFHTFKTTKNINKNPDFELTFSSLIEKLGKFVENSKILPMFSSLINKCSIKREKGKVQIPLLLGILY